jgi:myo-inositol-1(or 4)-monophosphatase
MSPGQTAPGSVFDRSRELDIDLVQVRSVAEGAARGAGQLLRERIGSIREIRHKGLVDLVTDVDEQSERLVRQTILAAFPTHSILGEEGGAVRGEDPQYRWIVDPLDGTTNYAHGFPFFCVSIAFEANGELLVGVVYDPSLDELFLAERGKGASLNGRPIQVSAEADLQRALLATGFPYDRRRFPRAMKAFEVMSLQSRAVRRAGSAALDLCYVACGRFEGYWEFVVNPWDVAGGVLLVTEAGGRVTRVDGSRFAVECGEVLASNGTIHEAMTEALASVPG